MKYLKRFNETFSDPWDDITSSYDVGQLLDLIHFKYGRDFLPQSSKEFDEDEGDYNPDDIYDTIRLELKESGKMDDFLQNYQTYAIERDENDPFHWRHRQKEMEKFNKAFNDFKNESFLDYFKKDSADDKITLDFIHRLEKVKDNNPYHIENIMQDDGRLPMWMSKAADTAERGSRSEYYSKIYVVKFDDVDILICNDRHNLVNAQTRAPAGEKKCVNQWKLFIGSDESKLCERIRSKESYRKKLFNLIDKIYNDDNERKRIERITNQINPAADLL